MLPAFAILSPRISKAAMIAAMELDPLAVVRRRMHAQRLTGEPFETPAEAVAWSGAVQAQEHAEAVSSLGMRVRECALRDVEAACDRGEIVRTHVLRPTWHFVAAADLRWLLRLTSRRVQAKCAGRHRELALGADTLTRAARALEAALCDGQALTRDELGVVLAAAGVLAAGPRLAHLLMHAELEGQLVSAPRRGRHHTYALLDHRVPAAPRRGRDEDVVELVLRYFTSHGPATLRDFAWWSGLTLADVRAGVAAAGDRLASARTPGGATWVAAAGEGPAPRSSAAFLLGTFDELLVAHRDVRNVYPDGRASAELVPRPIVRDGRTIGGWTRRLRRSEVTVSVVLGVRPDALLERALGEAVTRFGAFLGLPASLELSSRDGGGAGPGSRGSPRG